MKVTVQSSAWVVGLVMWHKDQSRGARAHTLYPSNRPADPQFSSADLSRLSVFLSWQRYTAIKDNYCITA